MGQTKNKGVLNFLSFLDSEFDSLDPIFDKYANQANIIYDCFTTILFCFKYVPFEKTLTRKDELDIKLGENIEVNFIEYFILLKDFEFFCKYFKFLIFWIFIIQASGIRTHILRVKI